MLTPQFGNIICEQHGEGIALLTINRAASGHALEAETLQDLTRALSEVDALGQIHAAFATI